MMKAGDGGAPESDKCPDKAAEVSTAMRVSEPLPNRKSEPALLELAGAAFIADPAGALFWPKEQLLVLADLHFEKGSAYGAKRIFLPPYDTAATLTRLEEVMVRLNPRRIIALGDSFHDRQGSARLAPQDRAKIRSLQRGRDWIWIMGNHDPMPPADLQGDVVEELALGPVHFRHEPRSGASEGEIAGHLHPVARVVGRAGSVRRRCFVSDGMRCVLPAFGAYAGGLNLHDAAFAALFGRRELYAHVMGRERVYRVSHKNCLPD